LRRRPDHSREAAAVLLQYLEFCKEYPNIIGAGYGSSLVATRRFHSETLVRLIGRTESWAAAAGPPPLAQRIKESRERYAAAMKAN
jgi:hypothetical protein